MYVILKGRVAVEQHSESTGGVPVVIAILTDGIHFGELSLLDNTSIENNTQKTFCVNQLGNQQFSGRAATCVTAEKCDLLVLDHEISLQLYQLNSTEQLQSKRTQNEEQSSTFLGDNISGRATQDFLSRKIRALQAVPYFSDVEPKILKNIAANLQIKTYLYGQCIQKRGEIPPGLFIILKGQCRVVAQIIARRRLPQKLPGEKGSEDQKIDYNKIRIVDKTIFNFNPITTFLNQTAYSEVAFQNQNLYLDKNGKEIKEELEFIDFMKFKQMKKGDFFGGRVLVPFQHFSNLKKLIFGNKSQEICYSPGKGRPKIDAKDEEIYHMKSLLSVVADSQIVEVWIIDKKMMEYLKEKDLKRIYEKIVQDNEADRPYHEKDIEYVIEQNKQFDQYKIDLVETMKKSKAYEKYFKGGT